MNAIPIRSSSSIRCTVNGRPVALEVRPEALLLDVLRDRLRLKGAKRSCDTQVCGACTVLVDGAPVSACTYLAVEVDGREVSTVEGLADGDRLDPLQEAFIERGAVQCGFCTAGMLMAAKALLAEDPAPTPERVVHYLRGNICRCTGYRAVVAEDESVAAHALDLIEVEYEELPAATTLEEALAPGAPLVHTSEPLAGYFADLSTLRPRPGTNICHQFHFERGRGAAAFAEADRVFEDTYSFPRVQHYAMEPHAAVAAWDEQGGLTVWASTQNPYSVRVELARMFRLPLGRIRIIVPLLGGGFGSKTYAKIEPIAAALARIARRPVRLALAAEEAFRTVRRCDARVHVRLGLRRDGLLLAAECRADFDV